MKNISQKPRRRNTPIKQLISITIARYSAASPKERQAILSFFDWVIQHTRNADLKQFHIQVKTRLEKGAKDE